MAAEVRDSSDQLRVCEFYTFYRILNYYYQLTEALVLCLFVCLISLVFDVILTSDDRDRILLIALEIDVWNFLSIFLIYGIFVDKKGEIFNSLK